MSSKKKIVSGSQTAFLLVMILVLSHDPNTASAPAEKRKTIFTTIPPQKWLVDRMVEDKFDVQVITKGDYHMFEISPSLLKKIGRASAYFSFGLGDSEENLIRKLKSIFPNLKVFDISEGVEKIKLNEHDKAGRSHRGHTHRYDPHVWLSPLAMKVVASNVLKVISELDPENAQTYKKNYERVVAELDSLHEDLKRILSPVRGKKFLVFHSAFRYLERDYGVIELSVEREGKEPTPKELKRIITEAKERGIKTIIVQTGFSQASARVIAKEINGKIVEIDHTDYNYIQNLRRIAELIRESCEGK